MFLSLALTTGLILNGAFVQETVIPQQSNNQAIELLESLGGQNIPHVPYVKDENVIVEERNGVLYLSSKEPKVIVKEKIVEKIVYVKEEKKPDPVTPKIEKEALPEPSKPAETVKEPDKEEPAEVVESAGESLGGGFKFTYYTATCAGCSGITATGVDVRSTSTYDGMAVIAVNPAVIPYWSIVEITLDNGRTFRAIALDTGGKMRQNPNYIDVLVGSESEAFSNGVNNGSIKIIRKGKG